MSYKNYSLTIQKFNHHYMMLYLCFSVYVIGLKRKFPFKSLCNNQRPTDGEWKLKLLSKGWSVLMNKQKVKEVFFSPFFLSFFPFSFFLSFFPSSAKNTRKSFRLSVCSSSIPETSEKEETQRKDIQNNKLQTPVNANSYESYLNLRLFLEIVALKWKIIKWVFFFVSVQLA